MNDKRKKIDMVVEVVCSYFNIDRMIIYNCPKKPLKVVSTARYHILHILHVRYGISISTLAKEFSMGVRGVFLGISKIKSWITTYDLDRKNFEDLCCELSRKELYLQ